MASELEVGGITAGGDVTVTNPSVNATLQVNASVGAYSLLKMYGTSGAARGLDIITGQGTTGYSSDNHLFRNAAQSTSYLAIDSTGLCSFTNGIAFSGQTESTTGTPAASSVLSHYETGEWTPVIKKGASAALAMTIKKGFYTRVGNMCFVSFYAYKASGTESTSGNWNVTGMPFPFAASNDSGYQSITGSYAVINGSTFAAEQRWQLNSTTVLTMYGPDNDANWASGALELSASGVFMVD